MVNECLFVRRQVKISSTRKAQGFGYGRSSPLLEAEWQRRQCHAEAYLSTAWCQGHTMSTSFTPLSYSSALSPR